MIGTGGISRVHLDWMRSRDDVEIAALCDVNAAALNERIEQYGGKGYSNMTEMIDTESLDAVWICTPQTVREEPLLLCTDREIPVFCEKPAAYDEQTAEAIASRIAGANVTVGYPFRTIPVLDVLRGYLAGDKVHTLQSLYVCDVSLSMGLRPWFYEQEKSGGAMVDQATHVFDLLRVLVGEVEQVTGIASNPVRGKREGYTIDEAIGLTMLYESGAVGTHVHSWVADTWRVEVALSGEQRLYRLDLTGNKLTVIENGRTTEHTYNTNLYSLENDHFLEMVTSGDFSANPCSYDDAARTLALTKRCNEVIAQ